jgi:hypothetical protein
MYAWLLLASDRIALASEYFALLVDRFGIHSEIIPVELLQQINNVYRGPFQPPSFKPTDVYVAEDYFPTQVACSLGGIASRWEKDGANERCQVLAFHAWNGTQNWRDDNASKSRIVSLSNVYCGYATDDGDVTVRRLANGELVAENVPMDKVRRLFANDTKSILSEERAWPPGPNIRFGGARITVVMDTCDDEDTFMSQYGEYQQWVTHTSGMLRFGIEY